MSNGDAERKAHVVRLYKDDDPDSDQWIDIERLDELSFTSGHGYQFRKKVWKFDWEVFNPEGENVTKKKIYDPNDEENFTEVPVRKSVLVKEGRGDQFQGNRHKFVNDDTNKTRETVSRRVYHHEIKERYLDAGEPPSDPTTYLDSLGDQDMGQYVEVELLDRYWSDQNESHDAQGRVKEAAWQEKKWRLTEADPLLQEPMLETDEVDPKFVPVHNPEDGPKVDPPWRLDPLQNIVNVQWGSKTIFVTGDYCCFCLLGKAKKDEMIWSALGSLQFTDGGQTWCSSYALVDGTPIFLLGGGIQAEGPDEFHNDAIIIASNNGEDWDEVFRLSPAGTEGGNCSVLELVWDQDKFYAGVASYEFNDDADLVFAKTYTSTNGRDWTLAGSMSVPLDASTDWGSPISSHYHPDANLPDGLFGYQEIKNDAGDVISSVMVVPNNTPKPHYAAAQMDDDDLGNTITFTRTSGESVETTTLTAPLVVYCAAYAKGIIVVGGLDGATASSFDDGMTWTSGLTSNFTIFCVSGGSKK